MGDALTNYPVNIFFPFFIRQQGSAIDKINCYIVKVL